MNNVVTAKYRFDRPEKSVVGFGRPNRPSTDAKGAVETWSIRVPGRDVIIVEDEDEFIVAELSFRESDTNAATDLDALCVERGVERCVV